MLTLVNGAMAMMGWSAETQLRTLIVYFAYFACYYGFAFFTYHAIEQPYLKLRDAAKK